MNYQVQGKHFVLLLVAVAILALPFFSVSAISYGGIGGRPAFPDPSVENSESWFIYNLDINEQREDAVTFVNPQETDERVIIYAADSLPSTDGGFALRQRSEEKHGVGSWIRFYPFVTPTTTEVIRGELFSGQLPPEDVMGVCKVRTTTFDELSEESLLYIESLEEWCEGEEEYEFELESQSELTVPFIITIPEGVAVGEHSGGILIQKVEKQDAESGGTGIKLTTRLGVRVYQTVPGEIVRGMSIEDFSYEYFSEKRVYALSLGVRNSGNVSQEFTVNYVFSDRFFGISSQTETRDFLVQPNDVYVSNFEWSPPKFGWFSVRADVTFNDTGDETQRISTESFTIVVIPWLEVGIGLLTIFIILVIALRVVLKSRKLRDSTGWKRYTVKKGDTVTDLADSRRVHWKRIVMVNNIKSPYTLKTSSKILLPPKKRTSSKKVRKK